MKVDNLLGPYLYQFKKLSLPGIGQFTLDERAVLPDENAKVKTPIEGIHFSPKTGPQLDDSLIQFIKEHTGKMRPLAEADLHSFITTAFQFLNIGKPFHIEGIGTLQKTKEGNYHFTAGTPIVQRVEDSPTRFTEPRRASAFTEEETSRKSGSGGGRLLVVLAVLVTLALIGWGGYYLYNKNTGPAEPAAENAAAVVADTSQAAAALVNDSLHATKPADSTVMATDSSLRVKKDSVAAPAAGTTAYKFILETTTKKARALKRYEQLKDVNMLKTYESKVVVETKDSLTFHIYTLINCPPADTAHVKDILNAWYYGNKPVRVTIEH